MEGSIWNFVLDGLFIVFTAGLLGVIAGTTNSFGALLFAIFGGTVEVEMNESATYIVNETTGETAFYTWANDTKEVLSESATMIKDISSVEGTVFPIGLYIITFVLFIGSVLGVVTLAMRSLAGARRGATTTPVTA